MDQQSTSAVNSSSASKTSSQENTKKEVKAVSGNFSNTMNDIDEKDTLSIQQSLQRDLDKKNSQISSLQQILNMEVEEKRQLSSELQAKKEINEVQANQIAELTQKVKRLENDLKQQNKEYPELIENSKKAAEQCQQYYNNLVEQANTMLKDGDFEYAIQKFQEALGIQKVSQDDKQECAYLLNQIAVCYMSSKKIDKALESLEIAIKLKEDCVDTLLNRGILYLEKNDRDGARKDFEAVRRLEPNNEYAKNMLKILNKK